MQQVAASNVPRVLVVGRFNSIHTRRFAEELQRQGVETAALCLAGSTDQPRLSCYQPKRIPRLFGLPKTALVASLFYLRWAIRDFKPDIIHVQDDPRMVKWLRWTRPENVKLAYTTWGHYPPHVLGDSRFQRSLRDAVMLASDALDVLDEIAPFAPRAMRQIMRFGADFETFTPGSPDPNVLAQYGLRPNGCYVLSPRSLRPSYNQITLIRALPAVIPHHPDLFAILKHHHVDNYDDADDYEREVLEEAGRLGIRDRIIRLNHLPHGHLRELYRASKVAVSIPLMDGFPASIFESMAAGCPLIVSNDASYAGVIEDGVNAIALEPQDDRALANALLKMLGDDSFRETIKQNAFRTARDKGDFEVEVARLIQSYRQLMGVR
jgi:glycosyltransferase involved in cell wall biosynthesis